MFVNIYHDNSEFNTATQNYSQIFRLGFVRNQFGLKAWPYDWMFSNDITDLDADGLVTQILRALPFTGTILGAGRLYSVWSTDTLDDRHIDKIVHTFMSLIEICGCGLVTLILKILYFALAFIITELSSFIIYIRKDKEAAEHFRDDLIDRFTCGL
ncbi:hypothetical protein [Chlamydia felis Fe/C-56]|uniref:Uncharacterized protein n=1 Tax=Chlamydia felis (strain Fe/C-56) TaxID=264202 RepID=Q254U9_CHLFF|nr:hypothetical protein [Chlamydia felis]BAE81189.1 hypothetical protein [Chlamydia felis Fe/C-56]